MSAYSSTACERVTLPSAVTEIPFISPFSNSANVSSRQTVGVTAKTGWLKASARVNPVIQMRLTITLCFLKSPLPDLPHVKHETGQDGIAAERRRIVQAFHRFPWTIEIDAPAQGIDQPSQPGAIFEIF